MPFGSLLDPKGVPWSPFGVIFGCFGVVFRALFFDRFLKGFCIDFGVILEAFLESFFGAFPSSRKMLHPTKVV